MTMPAILAKPKIHFLQLDQFPIFEQLQLEEALLRADERNWCILNTGTSPAIVMGISGKQEKLINKDLIRKNPVSIIKRCSGGGTVFVDGNTLFTTWICNTAHLGVPCCPQKVHEWTACFYQKALPTLEMNLKENDYVIGERKWGGNAQYLCKGRWLHHTSMLWDYDSANMRYLLMPEKIPSYRQLRSHDDFLCRLKDHFSDREHIKNNILECLHQHFDFCEVPLDEALEVLQRPHRKATCLGSET